VGDATTLQAEPYIAGHPEDPNNLIISACEVIKGQGIIVNAYFTLDGGRNWSVARLPQMKEALSAGSLYWACDDWVTYGANGDAYVTVLWLPPREGSAIAVYRSQDKGRTWQGPVMVPGKGFDQPRVIAAPKKGDPNVYVATALGDKVAVLKSSDGGLSFETTATLAPTNLAHQAMNPLVLADGSLLISFLDYPSYPSLKLSRQRLGASRIFVARSQDGGRTFGLPQFVADVPRASSGGGVNFAVDLSQGNFRGRLYAVWDSGDFGPRVLSRTPFVRVESGNRRELSVAYSTDNGRTWSEPKIVAQPGAGPAFFGTLAVAPDGTLGVLWIQHQRYETNPLCYRTYFAASVDGGESFAPPHVLSDAVSCPNRPELQKNDYFRYRYRGGDYIGLAAAADSTFHPVWTDAREGGFVIYTAAIRVRK